MQCGHSRFQHEDDVDPNYFCIREPDHDGVCRNGKGWSWRVLTLMEEVSELIYTEQLPATWGLSTAFQVPEHTV